MKKLNCCTLMFNDMSLERQVKVKHELPLDWFCGFDLTPVPPAPVLGLGGEGAAPLPELRGFHLHFYLRRPDVGVNEVSHSRG